MATEVGVTITAMVEHCKAESGCCGAKLALAPEEAPHEHDCTQCGQPTTRVLGEPRYIPATGTGVILPEDGDF